MLKRNILYLCLADKYNRVKSMPPIKRNIRMQQYKVQIFPKTLVFKQAAGTSRGVYTTRQVYYAQFTDVENPLRYGIGEFAPLPKLSQDDLPNYTELLKKFCQDFTEHGKLDIESLRPYPSILFGLEMAQKQLEANSALEIFGDTAFALGKEGLRINGLIWMGTKEQMFEAIEAKLAQGFHCIKLKVGAIDFEEELALVKHIRQHFSKEEIELRLDANGAFSPKNVHQKLEQLAQYDIHSIEQPITVNQWELLNKLCSGESPIPIALDEELIGHNSLSERSLLLDSIKPQYIILKPSLHGGFTGSDEWISEAENRNIGWWATSALESNIGLNAIAHWCASHKPSLPQGLGTGMLYTNNIALPLSIRGEKLWFNKA